MWLWWYCHLLPIFKNHYKLLHQSFITPLVTSVGQSIVLHLKGQIEAEVGSTFQVSVFYLSTVLIFLTTFSFYSFTFSKQTYGHFFVTYRGIIDYVQYLTQNVRIWHPRNETQQTTIFPVCLQTAGTTPTDSTFKFNSHWITFIWHEVQLALHRIG